MKRILLPILLVLTGCHQPAMQQNNAPPLDMQQNNAPPLEVLKPIKLSKSQIAAVHSGVITSLKDPESARFGNIIAGQDSKGHIVVCGYINAKNSFGGYTGNKPFLGGLVKNGTGFVVVWIGGAEVDTKVAFQICNMQGLAL